MMVEVFITDITKRCQAVEMLETIKQTYSELKINFDMDETGFPFPYGHTVLRAEGGNIDAKKIILMVKKSGFKCEIMENIMTQ